MTTDDAQNIDSCITCELCGKLTATFVGCYICARLICLGCEGASLDGEHTGLVCESCA